MWWNNDPPPSPTDGFYNFLLDPDPRTANFFMMSGTWRALPIAAIILYNYLFRVWFPENEDLIIKYGLTPEGISDYLNILGGFSNFIVSTQLLYYMWNSNYNWICQPVSRSGYEEDQIAALMYYYMLIKFLEFGDSLFIGVKNAVENDSGDSVLWHHSGLAFLSWMAVMYLPGGTVATLAAINSMAHCMYYARIARRINMAVERNICFTDYILNGHTVLIVLLVFASLTQDCGFPKFAKATVILFPLFLWVSWIYDKLSKILGNSGGGGTPGGNNSRPDRVKRQKKTGRGPNWDNEGPNKKDGGASNLVGWAPKEESSITGHRLETGVRNNVTIVGPGRTPLLLIWASS